LALGRQLRGHGGDVLVDPGGVQGHQREPGGTPRGLGELLREHRGELRRPARRPSTRAELATEPYPEGSLWIATIRDPAGNVIGIWQAGPHLVDVGSPRRDSIHQPLIAQVRHRPPDRGPAQFEFLHKV
jgi:hypothetical protein